MTDEPATYGVHDTNGETADKAARTTTEQQLAELHWADRLIPLATAAKYIGMTPAWLRKLHARGKVELVRPGGDTGTFYMPYREMLRLVGRERGATWK